MQIFQQEYDDGISDAISQKRSLSFASVVEPLSVDAVSKKIRAFGSIQDTDMYYVQSILVSSNWNKNDDIFEPEEIWKAKNTPEHKPTNLNHDEHIIVGHIISNYPITEDGLLIDKDTPVENLPKNFHILTGAVIYKAYTDPVLKEQTRELIAAIENGTKYVSMECYFDNFDYGITDPTTGSYKIVARDNDSAYLTKYLRAYGGSGQKDNYKIGRVLRNITFSGKGYVDKPANINSIILKNKLENFDDIKKDDSKKILSQNKGVSIDYSETHTVEACIMSKQEDMTNNVEIEETSNVAEQSVACETNNQETVEAQDAPVVSDTVQDTDNSAEAVVQRYEAEKEVMQQKLDEAEAAMKKMKNEMQKDKEALAEMSKKYQDMMKKEKMNKRMASLADCGFDQSDIEESLAAYELLTDEAFDAVLAVYKKKMDKMQNKPSEAAVATEIADTTKAEQDFDTTEEILDQVEETEALDLTVGGEEDSETNTTSAALIEYVYSRLGKKLNKGE